jgi:hypothetical protein
MNRLPHFGFSLFWLTKSVARFSRMLAIVGLMALLVVVLVGCGSWGNTGALKTENAALKARIPTLVYNSFQSNDLGMEFSYPADWVRQDTPQIVPFFVRPDGIANVGVTIEALPQVMTADAYFAALNQQLQARDYILTSERKLQAGNVSGIQAVYLNNGLIQVFFVVTKGQTAWSLIETAKAEDFMDWAHTFNEITLSFKVQ